MATQITKYVSDAGQEFNSLEEANMHDQHVAVFKLFEDASTYGNLTPSDAMDIVVRNADVFTNYLVAKRKAMK